MGSGNPRAFRRSRHNVVANRPSLLLWLECMRGLLPYVAVVMVYVMTPGSGELAENLVHLLANGHTAHAFDDAEHQPQGNEHCCSGPFHVCQCHTSTGFIVGVKHNRLGTALVRGERLSWACEEVEAEGHSVSLFRPPIA